MCSRKVQNIGAETVDPEKEMMGFRESKSINPGKKTGKKKSARYYLVRKFGCMRSIDGDGVSAVERHDVDGSFNVEAVSEGKDRAPTHLIVMINGIIGSARDWRYAAKKFVKAYPHDVLVHCSKSNSSMLTFDGVDVMGTRLAEEVISVVDRHPNLERISFVAHSLGGLIARYAVAKLYRPNFATNPAKQNGDCGGDGLNKSFAEEISRGTIAGLEPVSFITSATPHLGSRGHKQVPMFCGLPSLEKGASHASVLLGRTGKHLFLKDRENEKPPLLLQMCNDTDDLKFISALQSFRRRVAYANTRFDHFVGWSSSSLRLRNEFPKSRDLLKHAKYPHISVAIDIEESPKKANPQAEVVSYNAKISRSKTSEMEEAMITGLTSLTWERFDVNFGKSIQRLFAHSTIQVKTYWMHSAGTDVIRHMIDSFQL